MRILKIMLLPLFFIQICQEGNAQTGEITGKVTDSKGNALHGSTLSISMLNIATQTNSEGFYQLKGMPIGKWSIEASHLGFDFFLDTLYVKQGNNLYNIQLLETDLSLHEVVISATLKEGSKLDSPVPIEVYSAKFFKANPSPSLFEALQNINGVRPQLNCNICNTGDIHINGLEGPYTMVLIDGMPIVSGLSTVYGLSGIPQALIERIEIVKGPASTLYGSEAVGGLINIITKKTVQAPVLSADVFTTSWGELNVDLASKFKLGDKIQSIIGINYFNYQNPKDFNQDGFTDLTLQNRISILNKWSFNREDNRLFSLAARIVYEDRWGGELNWTRKYRGSDKVYGESIYTKRAELFGHYQLPVQEPIIFSFSTNGHQQNSQYGILSYLADQYISFGQLTWNKTLENHDIVTGIAYRYTYYDDNSPATADDVHPDQNKPSNSKLPGAFIQDEITFNTQHKILVGIRYDYNSIHGSIISPRINYKWNSTTKNTTLRLSMGNGYRVAHVFTEDHAALTGARKVIFLTDLKPEKSWNINLNVVQKIATPTVSIGIDGSIFYTYFNNKIIADYTRDQNKIYYDNLAGHGISRGMSINMDMAFSTGLKILVGATAMEVYSKENGEKSNQLFSEKFTGVWNIGYVLKRIGLNIDYTGNVYGPMRLPIQNQHDPRKTYSPWWSIQNIQLSKILFKNIETYAGIKNLLNWTPNRGNPFIIARATDPFNKNVQFDTNGLAMLSSENPYGLVFDPSYVYAPNQGIRIFLGIRYSLIH